MLAAVIVVQAVVTWALVGLIWTMQLVHYPLLAGVDPADQPRWHRFHMRRITLVVGPLMIVEAITAGLLALLVLRSGPLSLVPWAVGGGVLLVLIWLSTALVQAPAHGRLAAGFDVELHRKLVRTNWVRTWLWTARGVALGWVVLRILQGRLQI